MISVLAMPHYSRSRAGVSGSGLVPHSRARSTGYGVAVAVQHVDLPETSRTRVETASRPDKARDVLQYLQELAAFVFALPHLNL